MGFYTQYTQLGWYENKWINHLNAKININRIFLCGVQ